MVHRSALAVLIAAAAGTIASAQLSVFAGPFFYDPGVVAFGQGVYLVDLDGDGRDDVFHRSVLPASFRYRLSNPNGSLGPRFDFGTATTGVIAINDVGDGTPEVFRNTNATCPAPAIEGWLNDGLTCASGVALSLTPFAVSLPSCPVLPSRIQDFAISGAIIHASIGDLMSTAPPTIQTFAFNPPPTPGAQPTLTQLAPPYVLVSPNTTLAMVYKCELDGDGMPDLLIRTAGGFVPTLFELTRWTPGGLVLNTPTSSISIASFGVVHPLVHDLTGDGRDELVMPTSAGVIVYLNLGPGGAGGVLLTSNAPVAPGFAPIAFDDIDGDGDVDVIGMTNQTEIRALLNDGNAGLTLTSDFISSPSAGYVNSGDLDGDGDNDLVTGGTTPVAVYLNQTIPTVAAYPGTADLIGLRSTVQPTGVPGTYTGSPFFDIKAGASGADVDLELTALAFTGSPAYLLVEPFATGCPPSFPARKVYAGFGSATIVIGPIAVPPSGLINTITTTPQYMGPQNVSALCQFVILSPQSYNGQYASTEAHEIQF